MTESEIMQVFESAGAILKGHFRLTSGRHSDTYVQCARVLEDTEAATGLAQEIARRTEDLGAETVASPAVGGIVAGFAVAQALGARFVFAEREEGVMRLRRGFRVHEGEKVLVVEDVITTGGSAAEVARLVEEAGGEVVGFASLIDRSGGRAMGGRLRALLVLDVDSWDEDACPLCARGVPVDAPGSRHLGGGLA
ncbi:MAG: orotate phosphoribosyltransferase [Coriobacteriia bacterium]